GRSVVDATRSWRRGERSPARASSVRSSDRRMRARVYSAAAVACILTASAGCGGDSCAPGGRTGTAPLGAACGSDCDCATTNCYQGHCLPRLAWAARYLCDNSSSADVVADTSNETLVSGMLAAHMH